ncbi:3'-5' exonuclease domain-containing protein [Tieghemostelium lacteum]|uniref:3'-5' exonuclease domain-containing protein n=1 Tax=Tieghemostelium lacteum TaxID=361077 RepID=A0A152A1A6_TIELA|nr:3'-5' exonuclease domain-containing protein [Tieghemostelium lacteum]|eukprot:KYQ99864.1 3'-5' exonuclease domain-containing protein [Tieghemostelium lacteum]
MENNLIKESTDNQTESLETTQKKRGRPRKSNLSTSIEQLNNIDSINENQFKCPICNTVQLKEHMEVHFQQELTKLSDTKHNINPSVGLSNSNNGIANMNNNTLSRLPKRGATLNAISNINNNHTATYQLLSNIKSNRDLRDAKLINDLQHVIKSNRYSRLNSNISNGNNNSSHNDISQCFVCLKDLINLSPSDMNKHIDQCFAESELNSTTNGNRKQNSKKRTSTGKKKSKEIDPVNSLEIISDDDGEFSDLPPHTEIYEIDGIKRIRLCSLLENGYENILFDKKSTTSTNNNNNDDDLDLNIEDDDTLKFGEAQYSNNDITETVNNDQDLTTTTATTSTSTATTNSVNNENNNMDSQEMTSTTVTTTTSNSGSNNSFVLESLKQKVKDQEVLLRNIPTCIVCLENYKTPLISIHCWHTLCEQCWLSTLKVKKWCPRCMIITQPQDLRKIYL